MTRAAVELESAASDMDTSLAELRSPLEGRRLDEALRARAEELAREDGPRIEVHGEAPDLSALVGAHAYRIASEALTNALRHADATGIVYAGESNGDEESVWPLLRRVEPDLVLLDYHLPKGDGLQLCYRIKQHIPAPKVIIFSAYASPELMLPARLAHADGLINKGVAARELFETLRRVNQGERLVGEPSAAVLRETLARIPEEDRVLTGMLLDGASEADIARSTNLAAKDVRHVVQRTLSTLRRSAPVAG